MKSIIWDWNGTLLNDVGLICEVANGILARRGCQTLSVERIREVSCHPAKEWYRRMGVDFDRYCFEEIVTEFHHDYLEKFDQVDLHNDSAEVLADLRRMGHRQYVLSAHLHSSLVQNVDAHGITGHFEEVLGLDSGHAHSKLENGQELVARRELDLKSTILIGDSSHDAEVAAAIGVRCFLVARGLESAQRLLKTGNPVLNDLRSAVRAAELV